MYLYIYVSMCVCAWSCSCFFFQFFFIFFLAGMIVSAVCAVDASIFQKVVTIPNTPYQLPFGYCNTHTQRCQ